MIYERGIFDKLLLLWYKIIIIYIYIYIYNYRFRGGGIWIHQVQKWFNILYTEEITYVIYYSNTKYKNTWRYLTLIDPNRRYSRDEANVTASSFGGTTIDGLHWRRTLSVRAICGVDIGGAAATRAVSWTTQPQHCDGRGEPTLKKRGQKRALNEP